MNKPVFIIATIVIALLLIGLVCVRIALDGTAHTSPALRVVDTVAASALSILGFVVSLTVLVLGGDPPGSGIVFLLCGIVAGSLLWGLLIERVARLVKKNGTA